MRDEESIVETKVPILGDIPVIGWLFKYNNVSKKKLNLLVFVTPKIIRTISDSQRNLVHKAKQRIDWVKQNYGGRDPYGKNMDEMPRAPIPEGDERVEPNPKKQ
jgi:general secretion pathway protein D